MTISEAKVREIHQASDLRKYSHEELRAADEFNKSYAMATLRKRLSAFEHKAVRDYILLMARYHYGSVETDEFLQKLDCYPAWMNTK